MAEQPKQGEVKLRIKIDDSVAGGEYVNFANIMHNQSEFVIDFGRAVPNRQEISVLSRILISPVHAKNLLAALKRNVEQFEKTFGEIRSLPGGDDSRKVGF